MSKLERPSAFTLGLVAGFLLFVLGYLSRGSSIQHDAKLEQLTAMKESLSSIASNMPPQKIVEVEKVVYKQAPFCDVVKEQIEAKAPIPLRHDGLSFCKQLMYGGDNSNIRVPDLYDAINQWMEESDAPRGGIEDKIMSHVLLVLIDCFQKT